MRSRAEHLAWCKERALEYARAGELKNAVTSMMSDIQKHDGTRLEDQALAALGMVAIFDVELGDRAAIIKWIEGFN
jgi:hypothetical protein